MREARLALAGASLPITAETPEPPPPDVLTRRALAVFYGIPATRAQTVDDLTLEERYQAFGVLEVEAEIAGRGAGGNPAGRGPVNMHRAPAGALMFDVPDFDPGPE